MNVPIKTYNNQSNYLGILFLDKGFIKSFYNDNINIIAEVTGINEAVANIVTVRWYYIPNRRAYEKCNYKHDYLIIGYDHIGVYVNGYTINGKYETILVSFENMYKSIYHLNDSNEIIFIKATKNYDTEINFAQMKESIKHYLKSINSYKIKGINTSQGDIL